MKSFQTRKWYEEGCFVGEPIHIKNPTSNKEDNGVIVSTILDAKEKESFLLVLDAQTFKEQAKIYCTQPLNMGFHGNYFKL